MRRSCLRRSAQTRGGAHDHHQTRPRDRSRARVRRGRRPRRRLRVQAGRPGTHTHPHGWRRLLRLGAGGVDRRHEHGRPDPPHPRRGGDPADESSLDGLVAAWAAWAQTAPDVGIQTRNVLTGLEARTAAHSRAAARQEHDFKGQSAGNGSLMRTAPLVLGYLRDEEGEEAKLAEAARAISDLTHFEADAGDGCVLWCVAIRHAVLTGELDVLRGLELLDRRQLGRSDSSAPSTPNRSTSPTRTAGSCPRSRPPMPRSSRAPPWRTPSSARSAPETTPTRWPRSPGAWRERCTARRHSGRVARTAPRVAGAAGGRPGRPQRAGPRRAVARAGARSEDAVGDPPARPTWRARSHPDSAATVLGRP